MRCFFAVNVSPEISGYDISGIKRFARVSVVPPHNRHITLLFLGDISEDEAVTAGYCLRALDIKPFTVNMTHIGSFSDKVVYIGGGSPGLEAAREELARLLKLDNIPFCKQLFRLHATLCRVRQVRDKQMFANFIKSADASFQTSVFNVESIVLYRSVLKSSGAEYEPLYIRKF